MPEKLNYKCSKALHEVLYIQDKFEQGCSSLVIGSPVAHDIVSLASIVRSCLCFEYGKKKLVIFTQCPGLADRVYRGLVRCLNGCYKCERLSSCDSGNSAVYIASVEDELAPAYLLGDVGFVLGVGSGESLQAKASRLRFVCKFISGVNKDSKLLLLEV